MIYPADTNVAVRRVLTSDPLHHVIKRALDVLMVRGDTVAITPQVLIEFHALAIGL